MTYAEIVSLTGKKRFKAQARALSKMHIRFVPRPDGSLVVSRALVTSILGKLDTYPATTPPSDGAVFDFGARPRKRG